MKYTFILCSFGALILSICRCANILVYIQVPSYSHQIAFRPLWQELAKRGHRITLLTTDLMEENENITQVDLSKAYKLLEKYNIYENLYKGEDMVKMLVANINLIAGVLEYEVSHPIVQDLLKNGTKFDLVISEGLMLIGFAFAAKLQVPSVGVVSMDGSHLVHDAVGNPSHPIVNPDFNLPFSIPLNFKERVLSVLYSIISKAAVIFILDPMQEKLIKKYIGELAPTDEILKNISMVFINTNLIFYNTRPLGPKTINIGGGIHLSPPKRLPKELEDFLDNAEDGAIYFSLGSNVRSSFISNQTRQIFVETFSQLPYRILWKFETGELQGKPDNVKIMKWLPQQDVLRHKNIKLFITQGGVQSMEEAIFNYVPIVGMPFFGDQHNNIRKIVEKGLGLSVDHTTLNVESFTSTILEVINNPRYKQRTKELADLVLDQPMTGLEKAVWWTEYVLRHGGTEHFRNPVVDLPLYQYYLLDVIAFIIVITIILIYVLYKLLQFLWIIIKTLFKWTINTNEKQKVS